MRARCNPLGREIEVVVVRSLGLRPREAQGFTSQYLAVCRGLRFEHLQLVLGGSVIDQKKQHESLVQLFLAVADWMDGECHRSLKLDAEALREIKQTFRKVHGGKQIYSDAVDATNAKFEADLIHYFGA